MRAELQPEPVTLSLRARNPEVTGSHRRHSEIHFVKHPQKRYNFIKNHAGGVIQWDAWMDESPLEIHKFREATCWKDRSSV